MPPSPVPPACVVGFVGPPPGNMERELVAAGVTTLHFSPASAPDPWGAVAWPRAGEADVLVLGVRVPLTPSGGADAGPLAAAAGAVGRHLRPGQLVVVCTPVPPGTTRQVVLPALAASGRSEETFLAYLSEGTGGGRLVGGAERVSGDVAAALLGRLPRPVVRVSSADAAEACGAAAAVLRTVRSAVATELYRAWEKLGIDGREVAAAAGLADLTPHRPGEEPAALFAWGCRRVRADTRLLSAAAAVNAAVPEALAGEVTDALNRLGRAVRGSRVLLVVADDETTASTAADVRLRLTGRGAVVDVVTADHLPRPAGDGPAGGDDCALLLARPSPADLDALAGRGGLVVDAAGGK